MSARSLIVPKTDTTLLEAFSGKKDSLKNPQSDGGTPLVVKPPTEFSIDFARIVEVESAKGQAVVQ